MNNGNVLITTNEYRVTDTIYSAIINNGVCMPLWLGNSSSLDGVKSIMVLNKFKKQGYVFEGGADVCNKLGKLKSQQAKIYLMGNSHIY